MRLSENDSEILNIIEEDESNDTYLLELSTPDTGISNESDGIVTSLRSRLARQFYDGFAVPEGFDFERYQELVRYGRWNREFYDPVNPVDVGDESFLYVLTNSSSQEFNPIGIREGMDLGRIGSFNKKDIAVNPEDYSEDYPRESAEIEAITNGLTFEKYQWVEHPILHPKIPDEARERFPTAGNRLIAEIDPQIIEPVEVNGNIDEFSTMDLDKLVEERDSCYWKVGPGSYLSRTESPVTFEGFYTVLVDRYSAGSHHNSRIGDPDWEEPMILEHKYDQIKGPTENIETAYDFPQAIDILLLKQTD